MRVERNKGRERPKKKDGKNCVSKDLREKKS